MQIKILKKIIFYCLHFTVIKYTFYHLFRRTDVDAASGTKSGTLKFVRTLTNISKDAGGIAHMRCEVVGDPPPTKIRWYKNEAPLEENRPKITIRKIHAQVRVIVKLLVCTTVSLKFCVRKILSLSNSIFFIVKKKFKFYICVYLFIYFIKKSFCIFSFSVYL